MTIGQRIKKRRIELNLSVDELADKLGKNRATVYRYEKDDIKELPITVLEPLAKILETTPADLMGWGDDDIEEPIDIQQDKSIDEIINMLPGRIAKHTYTYSKLNDGNKSLVDVYTDKILDIQAMTDNIPIAAHERTDINVTNDMIKHDDDIMNDDNF